MRMKKTKEQIELTNDSIEVEKSLIKDKHIIDDLNQDLVFHPEFETLSTEEIIKQATIRGVNFNRNVVELPHKQAIKWHFEKAPRKYGNAQKFREVKWIYYQYSKDSINPQQLANGVFLYYIIPLRKYYHYRIPKSIQDRNYIAMLKLLDIYKSQIKIGEKMVEYSGGELIKAPIQRLNKYYRYWHYIPHSDLKYIENITELPELYDFHPMSLRLDLGNQELIKELAHEIHEI